MIQHIVMLAPYYPPHLGGLENYAHDLALQLANDRVVTVLTADVPPGQLPEEQASPTLRIIRFPIIEPVPNYPLPCFWKKSFWHSLSQTLRPRPQFIISHTRFFLTSALALGLAIRYRLPWIHIEHGSWYVKVGNRGTNFLAWVSDQTLGRLIFRTSSINVCISKAVQQFVKMFDGRPSPVIYRGLNFKWLDTISPRLPPLIDAQEKIVIVMAGRLFRWKGTHIAVETIAHLPESLKNKIIFLIIGAGEEELLLQRTISAPTYFVGPLSHTETIAALKAADIYIHASYKGGGLSTSLLEAMACQCAIVATPHEGADEMITPGVTGLIVPAGNSSALGQTLQKLITDSTFRHEIAERAALHVRDTISWEHARTSFEHILTQLEPRL